MDIVNQINEKMRGTNQGHRSVIVFFKDLEKLKEFERSDRFLNSVKNYSPLPEHNDDREKESIVSKATVAKMVTLSTKSFGRGTDFICRDPEVENNGGVHVICTFVPELQTEFV